MNRYNVAVLEFNQETNTFSKLKTAFRDFQMCHYFVGSEIEAVCRGTNCEIGGFIDCCDRFGWQPIYTVAARAEPGGIIEEAMRRRFVNDVSAALRGRTIDGVFIVFHGAMSTETAEDAQVQLLEIIRGLVGRDIPIAATFDLHANAAPQMSELLDIAVSFRTYPHVDMAECGRKAGSILDAAMRKSIAPAIRICQPAMLTGCNDGRTTHPCSMTEILEIADAIEANDGILATSVNAGFYEADVYNAGPSAVVCYDRNVVADDEAAAHAERLCQEIMARKGDYDRQLPLQELAPAVRAHFQAERKAGPLIIADFSDNPGAGAYGDATAILATLLDMKVVNTAVGAIYDPAAARALCRAGVGAEREVLLGCKVDPLVGGGPLKVKGTVRAVSDGNVTLEGPMFKGLPASLGESVRFHVNGIDILISSERQQMLDQNFFRAVGIEVADFDIVVVKSQQHFRAAFGPIAAAIIEVDAGGLCTPNLGSRTYRRVRRPVFPLDRDQIPD